MAKSKQPFYTFSNIETEQLEQLKSNPLMEKFRKYRAENKLTSPAYHFWSPDGGINDPNGLCRWNGKYHLFYQQFPQADPAVHWGHAVSDDMVHWEDLPTAIAPDMEDSCYSGNTLVEDNRVIAMYHGRGLGNMVASSSDPLLLNWEKNPNNPVIPNPPDDPDAPHIYSVFDPFIWKEEDGYYALSASKVRDGYMAEYLFFSQNLDKWIYLGPLMDSNPFVESPNDGACPYFLPFGEEKNGRILLFFSHGSGSRALIGTYNKVTHKFIPKKALVISHESVGSSSLVAPCAMSDGNGGVYVIYNMGDSLDDTLDASLDESARMGVFTLMRHITTDSEGNVWIRPAKENESLRAKEMLNESLSLPAFEKKSVNAKGKCLEITAEINLMKSRAVEFKVLSDENGKEYTSITVSVGRNVGAPCLYLTIDTTHSSRAANLTGRIPESTQRIPWNRGEKVNLRIFVDTCMVEAFINDRAACCQFAYAVLPESDGITAEAMGGDAKIENIKVYDMKSIY